MSSSIASPEHTTKLVALLILLICWLALPAQATDEPQWPNPMSANTEYLTDLRLLRQELTKFAADRRWRDVIVQVMATQYSFVGRHQKALELFDEVLGRSASDPRPGMLAGLEPCDAVQTILELAERRQVVMVNEAHHVPMHRAFTIQLLEALHRQGFRYFAVETLSAGDTGLQSRGYPTRKSGFYISEPVCADMLRIALQLGYQVVPYEFEEETPPRSGDDPLAGQRAREEGQAKNLKDRILVNDPKARILVHAGYSHISKKVVKGHQGELRFMARAFQDMTGIEPLCIDQTLMTEHSRQAKESAEYRSAVEKEFVKDKPVVLRDQIAKRWFQPSPTEEILSDLVVVHPRSRYQDGRPTWLRMGGLRRPHAVRTEFRPPPASTYLAQAFYAKETDADAVPIDQMEYGPDEPIPTLWLPAGAIRIRVVEGSGQTLHEYAIEAGPASPLDDAPGASR